MNMTDLNEILTEHKIWIESRQGKGARADLIDATLPDRTFVLMGHANNQW
ncbi:hypothetical protein LU631_15605 [Erwinia tracheiphila]|nr:hypothetical protein [Erwinia tracheiphila]EOS96820.1 pentapeptide repeat-containing protein [Erwinia tracheiphila PSU-1]UIA86409.1 hypothetical protein LU631_15605 [Erwinia tracheiphila]UIA94758.1 hypothetical protein LU633_14060 [Erwinia tracheiphila]